MFCKYLCVKVNNLGVEMHVKTTQTASQARIFEIEVEILHCLRALLLRYLYTQHSASNSGTQRTQIRMKYVYPGSNTAYALSNTIKDPTQQSQRGGGESDIVTVHTLIRHTSTMLRKCWHVYKYAQIHVALAGCVIIRFRLDATSYNQPSCNSKILYDFAPSICPNTCLHATPIFKIRANERFLYSIHFWELYTHSTPHTLKNTDDVYAHLRVWVNYMQGLDSQALAQSLLHARPWENLRSLLHLGQNHIRLQFFELRHVCSVASQSCKHYG